MNRALVGYTLVFLLVAPPGWSQAAPARKRAVTQPQTMLTVQARQLAKLTATRKAAEIQDLLNSDPPMFCVVIPAVTMMVLASEEPGKTTWSFDMLKPEGKIAFERYYTQVEGKLRTCLNQAVQTSDDEAMQTTVLAWSVLEARHLDLRASLLMDAIGRNEQLSSNVEELKKIAQEANQDARADHEAATQAQANVVQLSQAVSTLAANQAAAQETVNSLRKVAAAAEADRQEHEASRNGRLAAVSQALNSWIEYQRELSVYRQTYANAQASTSFRQQPLNVFDMTERAKENLRNAMPPPLINCTTMVLVGGTLQTRCQ